MAFYRDFSIPKKNGKPRLISAPDRDLKKKQRMLLPMLYRIHRKLVMDMNLKDIQHGFIPGKNCVTAAQKHIGFRYTTQLDISDFFNSCRKDIHFRGMHQISRYKNTLFHDNGYCAQGFVTSPILANIASLNVISEIKEKLNSLFQSVETENQTKRPKFAFTIYADDIQISYNDKSLKKEIIQIIGDSFMRGGFQINRRKTRTRSATCGFRKILGINVGDESIRGSRKTMRKIRAANHQGNYHSKGGLQSWANCHKPKKLNTVI